MSYANMDGVPTQTAGTSELLATDWNTYVRDNFDSIKFGHIVCTSTTRPTGIAEGTMIYETDTNTNKVLVYSGSAWVEVANLNNVGGLSTAASALISGSAGLRVVAASTSFGSNSLNPFVTWDSAPFESPNTLWDVSAPQEITVPTTGLYLFNTVGVFSNASSNLKYFTQAFYVNNVLNTILDQDVVYVASRTYNLSFNVILQLNSSDVIKTIFQVYTGLQPWSGSAASVSMSVSKL